MVTRARSSSISMTLPVTGAKLFAWSMPIRRRARFVDAVFDGNSTGISPKIPGILSGGIDPIQAHALHRPAHKPSYYSPSIRRGNHVQSQPQFPALYRHRRPHRGRKDHARQPDGQALPGQYGARDLRGKPVSGAFYADRDAYAFQTEMFFLLSRYKQQEQFAQRDLFSALSVSDYLFVKSRLFASLTLSDHELALYDRMYTILTNQIPTPDVVVHLHAPLEVLSGRIKKRGRSYEENMDLDYLDRLRGLYHNFFAHYDEAALIEVDTSDVNFSEDRAALEALMARIQRAYQARNAPAQLIEF